ncbi:MAG TPA: hypothetical protein VGZ28_07900, partial [Terriglobales bacterium]|nr:hypothetical protein [Terriglobales bacterium]
MLGFDVQPLADFPGRFLLRWPFFCDVGGDHNFGSVSESQKPGVGEVPRIMHLKTEGAQNKAAPQSEREGCVVPPP